MRQIITFLIATILILELSACAPRRLSDTGRASRETVLNLEFAEPINHKAKAPKSLGSGLGHDPSVSIVGLNRFRSHKAHKRDIRALVASRAGFDAYSGSTSGDLVNSQLIELPSGKLLTRSQLIATSNRPILSLALSPDQSELAVGQFSRVTIIDLKSKSVKFTMNRVVGRIVELAYDPLGNFVAIGTAAGRVYVWNLRSAPNAGENSLYALEEYPGATSPISALMLHPAGRIIFAGERNGRVHLWRLLRTDKEMGLRDPNAIVDKKLIQRGSKRIVELPHEIVEGFLSDAGQSLNLVFSDGSVRSWKIRGMVPEQVVTRQSTVSLVEFEANSKLKLIASALRTQKLEFWCKGSEQIIAETELFTEPISSLAAGSGGPLLWVAQKTGNLSSFDSRFILNNKALRTEISRCDEHSREN